MWWQCDGLRKKKKKSCFLKMGLHEASSFSQGHLDAEKKTGFFFHGLSAHMQRPENKSTRKIEERGGRDATQISDTNIKSHSTHWFFWPCFFSSPNFVRSCFLVVMMLLGIFFSALQLFYLSWNVKVLPLLIYIYGQINLCLRSHRLTHLLFGFRTLFLVHQSGKLSSSPQDVLQSKAIPNRLE